MRSSWAPRSCRVEVAFSALKHLLLAGVIGGLDSAIGESSTRIVLESACFQAASVRKTSSALKLRTDASMRFEKSQDPMNTVRGLERAVAQAEALLTRSGACDG